MIHQNNESPLISTHPRLPNVQEQSLKSSSLMIPSYMIELRNLLDRYPTFELNSFWLKNLLLVALEQLRDSLKEIQGSALATTCYGVAKYDTSKSYKALSWLLRFDNILMELNFFLVVNALLQSSVEISEVRLCLAEWKENWKDGKLKAQLQQLPFCGLDGVPISLLIPSLEQPCL
ncbi:hypothetical protein Gotur_026687 [Gossypium turneri]